MRRPANWRSRSSRGGILAVGLLTLTAPARAQSSGRWSSSITLRQTFTDNLFLTPDATFADTFTTPTLTVAYGRARQTRSLGVFGWVSPRLFEGTSTFDRGAYGIGASGQVALSPIARLRVSAAYSDGLNVEALFASNFSQPQFAVKSFSADAGLFYQFGQRTTADVSLGTFSTRYHAGIFFDSAMLPAETQTPADVLEPLRQPPPDPVQPVGPDNTPRVLGLLTPEGLRSPRFDYWSTSVGIRLLHRLSHRSSVAAGLGYRQTRREDLVRNDGDQIHAQLALNRVLSDTARISFSYNVQASRYQNVHRTHSFRFGTGKVLQPRLNLDVSIGASYRDDPGLSGWDLVGGAGLSWSYRRLALAARYDRTRYQSAIVGRNFTTDTAFAGFGYRVTRKIFFTAYGYYLAASGIRGGLVGYRRALVSGSLTVPLTRRARTGATYAYWLYSGGALSTAGRNVLSVFITYSPQPR